MLLAAPPLGEVERRVLADVANLRDGLQGYLAAPYRWMGSLRRLSLARNVQGSNSIEGFTAGLDDAAAVIDGQAPSEADEAVRHALEGYRNAMTYVLQLSADGESFEFSAQLIKSIHFMMTGYDLKSRPGRWRSGDIFVRNEDRGAVVYEGPPVEAVPALVDELTAALNRPGEFPMVDAAMAHLNLVMIHPFRDGNGRMARCLQSLVLGREGNLSPVFMSVEEYLGRNTAAYYAVLEQVGVGKWRPEADTRPWLRFMLTAHLRQARTYRQRLRDYEHLWLRLNDLVGGDGESRLLAVLFDATVGLRITRSSYRASLMANGEEISDQTAGRDLKQLADSDLLAPQGEKRGRYYLASAPLSRIWSDIRAARPARDDTDPFDSV